MDEQLRRLLLKLLVLVPCKPHLRACIIGRLPQNSTAAPVRCIRFSGSALQRPVSGGPVGWQGRPITTNGTDSTNESAIRRH